MAAPVPKSRIDLSQRPEIALIAVGVHGPNLTQRFRSDRHWWLHLYSYHAALRVGDCTLDLRPGCASLIPPGLEIEYEFRERATHLCAHFTLADEPAAGMEIPMLQDLGADFARVHQLLQEAGASFAGNPARAAVRLWDILWQLCERVPPGSPPVHVSPAPVERARQLVEMRLGEPISVAALAREVGVSHNHLIRLFHTAVGETVIGYIRGRRVQRARHLLEHTTLPIKTIAAQVGVEDTRQFYKLIRATLGCSPTEVRQNEQAGSPCQIACSSAAKLSRRYFSKG